MTLPTCTCGAPAIAIEPGETETRAPGGILIQAARPTRAWCSACWPWRYAALGALGVAAGQREVRT